MRAPRGGSPAAECLAHIDDEVEARRHAGARAGDLHQQLAMEEAVAGVEGFAREVELRGQEPLAGRLHLDVIVPRAPGIEPRLDGAEAIAALRVGEDMAAIAEAAIVVVAALVRMPQIDERALDRTAAAREHVTCQLDRPTLAARLREVEALGRARAIERTLDLRQRRRIVVLAFRRRDEIGLRPSRTGSSDPGERAAAQETTAADDGHKSTPWLEDLSHSSG